MKSFAQTFFTHFGATIKEQRGEMVVTLPPDLVEVFGKPHLYLVFPSQDGEAHDLSPHEDLLVYGSLTFDRMLGLLENRGQVAHMQFPAPFALSETPKRSPVTLTNCHLEGLQILDRANSHYYVFTFEVDYVSDEKQETFITVIVDDDGYPAPDQAEILSSPDLLFLVPNTGQPPTAEAISFALSHASEIAYQQVDEVATLQEKEIETRLEKVLLRLTTFYHRLIREVNTADSERDKRVRGDLQQDLKQKITAELERHRLRVTVTPTSYALVLLPYAVYRLDLSTRYSQRVIALQQNLYNGEIEHFSFMDHLPSLAGDEEPTTQVKVFNCHHCAEQLDHVALCDRGHVVHLQCLEMCYRCGKDVCYACGIQTGAISESWVCVDCIATCAYCTRWISDEYIEPCAICSQQFCPDHSVACSTCQQLYCQACLVDDVCKTCHTAQDSEFVAGLLPPTGPGKPLKKVGRYQWRQAENDAVLVYLGQSIIWGKFTVVVNKRGRIVHQAKSGLLSRVFG